MPENQHTEWKETWRDEFLKWICGFANAEGGVLVIGRNDAGQPVGVPDAARLLQDIPNKVRDVLGIMVAVNLRREAGRDLVEIVVEPYPTPISYRGEYHFFRAGEIEAWGRGVQRIFEACRQAGSPAPVIDYTPGDLWIEFPFSPAYLQTLATPQETTGLGESWGEKWGPAMTAKRRKIAEAMVRNPRVTIPQLAAEIRLDTTGIENHLKVMRETGCIKRVGPAKGGHWEVVP